MSYEHPRRSRRISKELSILLIGSDIDGKGFSEMTKTVVLSRHGAGVVSKYKLGAEQEIILRYLDTNKETVIRVVGQIGNQSDSYTYGVAFLDENINFWETDFPPASEAEKLARRALLECGSCKQRETVDQSETESDVLMVNEGIVRFCKNCGDSTFWNRISAAPEAQPASPAPEQESEPKQAPAPSFAATPAPSLFPGLVSRAAESAPPSPAPALIIEVEPEPLPAQSAAVSEPPTPPPASTPQVNTEPFPYLTSVPGGAAEPSQPSSIPAPEHMPEPPASPTTGPRGAGSEPSPPPPPAPTLQQTPEPSLSLAPASNAPSEAPLPPPPSAPASEQMPELAASPTPAPGAAGSELPSPPPAAQAPQPKPKPQYANRRKHARMKANYKACIRRPGFPDDVVTCEDMSRGGICFKSRKRYYEMTSIDVAVPYSPDDQAIFVPANIVWVLELPDEKLYKCGLVYRLTAKTF